MVGRTLVGGRTLQVVIWGLGSLLEGLGVEIDCLSVVLGVEGPEALVGEGSGGRHPR